MAGKRGRPQNPNKLKIQQEICKRISTSNKSLPTVLAELKKDIDNVPEFWCVWKWLDKDKDFAQDYARAKEQQCEFLAEEILEISDDSSLDVAFTEEGKPFIDKEHIHRSRLRVDTRKWILSKLKPKKYGDKLELAGDPKNPLIPDSLTNLERATRLAFLLTKAKEKRDGKKGY